jgi:hypothetical protein
MHLEHTIQHQTRQLTINHLFLLNKNPQDVGGRKCQSPCGLTFSDDEYNEKIHGGSSDPINTLSASAGPDAWPSSKACFATRPGCMAEQQSLLCDQARMHGDGIVPRASPLRYDPGPSSKACFATRPLRRRPRWPRLFLLLVFSQKWRLFLNSQFELVTFVFYFYSL